MLIRLASLILGHAQAFGKNHISLDLEIGTWQLNVHGERHFVGTHGGISESSKLPIVKNIDDYIDILI